MVITCSSYLRTNIIKYINEKYNKQYISINIDYISFKTDSLIVLMNDYTEYKIRYEIDFS